MKIKIEDKEIIIIPETPQDDAYLNFYFRTAQRLPKVELKPVEFPAGPPGTGGYDKTCLVITSCLKDLED